MSPILSTILSATYNNKKATNENIINITFLTALIREIKIHVYAKRQTWICTTWPSFPLVFRLLFIASTQK